MPAPLVQALLIQISAQPTHAELRCAAPASPPQYERRRPEQTPLYRLVQQHFETFAAEVAGLPQFVKDEFDVYLECGNWRMVVSICFYLLFYNSVRRWNKLLCTFVYGVQDQYSLLLKPQLKE